MAQDKIHKARSKHQKRAAHVAPTLRRVCFIAQPKRRATFSSIQGPPLDHPRTTMNWAIVPRTHLDRSRTKLKQKHEENNGTCMDIQQWEDLRVTDVEDARSGLDHLGITKTLKFQWGDE
ncbi:hypothetical protein F511_19821 [Dorcoceras hygrometricum]|uniref:Uncharacterized protein n=1 Tax=Dorcoceras hygrometricum TaxID=472368 RepID=A0A2Z7BT62_9LAMI|nr:hypothetical protein F511_19821 [Dorcoceras hygrometricum]